jgi:hypothetical protein
VRHRSSLSSFEERLAAVQASRDAMAARVEQSSKEYETLSQQVVNERKQLDKWLADERNGKADSDKHVRALQVDTTSNSSSSLTPSHLRLMHGWYRMI